MSFQNQEVMMIPDRVLKSVFPERHAIDKLIFPRGVPKSVSRDKHRMVTLVGRGYEHTKKMFQDKIDNLQSEREAWLQANGSEQDRKDIRHDLEMEKLRVGSNKMNSSIARLQRELSIVEAKLKKENEMVPTSQ